MTQAPTPTADTVRRLVRSLLKDGVDDSAGPEVRPASPGAEPATWWVGTRHVLRLARDREAAVQLAAQPGTAVLVHHALTGDHLVVSADGRVRGVLGWADTVLGDPAEDIAGLARALGSPAAVRAATLAGYGARPCLRGLWLARCDTVLNLAARLAGEREEPLTQLRAQLNHAWETILLERVTEFREDDEGL